MIKAISIDFNGCIFSHAKEEIPASALDAFHKLQEKGIKLIMATGRNGDMIAHLPIHEIEWDGYVYLGGQVLVDKDGTLLKEVFVEDTSTLLKIFNEKKHSISLVQKDDECTNIVTDQTIEALNAIHNHVPEVKEFSGAPIYHGVFYISKEEEAELAPLLTDYSIFRWHKYGTNVVLNTASKENGTKFFLERWGISPDELMSFGDNDNDIGLLKYAKIGVALGEGTPEAKATADYVTTGIDDDGVLNALKHYNIL